VVLVTERDPIVLAKEVASLDLISRGRFIFGVGAGWNAEEMEKEILYSIINPSDNYETVRYIHSPYTQNLDEYSIQQTDIWYYFYFLDGSNYLPNYEATRLTLEENSRI
jgi:hypothetical protein